MQCSSARNTLAINIPVSFRLLCIALSSRCFLRGFLCAGSQISFKIKLARSLLNHFIESPSVIHTLPFWTPCGATIHKHLERSGELAKLSMLFCSTNEIYKARLTETYAPNSFKTADETKFATSLNTASTSLDRTLVAVALQA